jgi:hypothetical protein
LQFNAIGCAPGSNRFVSLELAVLSGFLMGPYLGYRLHTMDAIKNIRRFADSLKEFATNRLNIAIKLFKSFLNEYLMLP